MSRRKAFPLFASQSAYWVSNDFVERCDGSVDLGGIKVEIFRILAGQVTRLAAMVEGLRNTSSVQARTAKDIQEISWERFPLSVDTVDKEREKRLRKKEKKAAGGNERKRRRSSGRRMNVCYSSKNLGRLLISKETFISATTKTSGLRILCHYNGGFNETKTSGLLLELEINYDTILALILSAKINSEVKRRGLAKQLEDLFFLHFLSMLIFIDDDQWINDELGADRMDGLVDLEQNNEEMLMVVTRCNMVIKFVVKEHGRE
ncbi:hypothetical protein Tco_0972703 [Tanacetum coccineum]